MSCGQSACIYLYFHKAFGDLKWVRYGLITEFKQRRRHRERQKSNWFRLAKQLCTCNMLFLSFFFAVTLRIARKWNLLISRFMEDVDTRQRFSFSFCELRYSVPFGIQLQKKSPTFDKIKRVELKYRISSNNSRHSINRLPRIIAPLWRKYLK